MEKGCIQVFVATPKDVLRAGSKKGPGSATLLVSHLKLSDNFLKLLCSFVFTMIAMDYQYFLLFQVKPPWVKETLSDSEDEESKGDQEQAGGEQQQGGEQRGEEQQDGDQQDQEHQQQLADSLPLESIQTPAPMVVESLDTSAPPLDTPAPMESIDTPAPPDMMHDPTTTATPADDFDAAMAAVDDASGGGTSLDDTMHATGGGGGEDESNVAVTQQQHFDTHHHHQLDGGEVPSHGEGQGQPPPALTEEDLLTGPAHNLDDVEANLEDIFK